MKNDKPLKLKVLVCFVVLVFMCLCDLYIIVNLSHNYQILAIGACITFVWMTLTLDGWMNWREMESQERDAQYQDILKAEKSSYLAFQKKTEELDNKLNFIGQKIMGLEKGNTAGQKRIEAMVRKLLEEQKRIAKLTIGSSKENADALMNSHNQLLKQMEQFLEMADAMEGGWNVGQGGDYQQDLKELKESQKEVLDGISKLWDNSSMQPAKPAGGLSEVTEEEMAALLSGTDTTETAGQSPLDNTKSTDKETLEETKGAEAKEPDDTNSTGQEPADKIEAEESGLSEDTGGMGAEEAASAALESQAPSNSAGEEEPEAEKALNAMDEKAEESSPESEGKPEAAEVAKASSAMDEKDKEAGKEEAVPDAAGEGNTIEAELEKAVPDAADGGKKPVETVASKEPDGAVDKKRLAELQEAQAVKEVKTETAKTGEGQNPKAQEAGAEGMPKPGTGTDGKGSGEKPADGARKALGAGPSGSMSPEDIAALVAGTAAPSGQGMAENTRNASGTPAKAGALKAEVPKPKPTKANPNGMMSPEEIAALIANSEVDELPEELPEVKTEKPAMPDMSDPGKTMSPEEIAALIANM